MKMEPIRDANGMLAGPIIITAKKTAFCDFHSPQTDDTPGGEVGVSGGAESSLEEDSRGSASSMIPAEAKEQSRKKKLSQARKVVAKELGACPTLSIPVISPGRYDIIITV